MLTYKLFSQYRQYKICFKNYYLKLHLI